MTAYQNISLATNLSVLVQSLAVQDEAMRSLERGANAAAPTIKPTGLLWNRTDEATVGEAIMRWNGSAWTLLLDPESAQINAGGSIAFAADQPMGGFKLTGLAAGSAAGHSVRYQQVLKVSESTGALLANLDAGGFKVTNLGAGSAASDALRFDQRFPDNSGLFDFNNFITLETDADPTNTYQVCRGGPNATNNFAPRMLYLRFTGNVTDQSDGDLHGTIDKEYVARWWFDDDVKVLETALAVGGGGITVRIEVERKTSSPQGIVVRVQRTDNDERQNVGRVEMMAFGGVGNGGGG